MRTIEVEQKLTDLKLIIETGPTFGSQDEVIETLDSYCKIIDDSWGVPRLHKHHPMYKAASDGTQLISLLVHELLINSDGAFCIINCYSPATIFTMRESSLGRKFRLPTEFKGRYYSE